jgi:hypothetical protein
VLNSSSFHPAADPAQQRVVTLYNPGPVADMIRADGGRVRDMGMTRNTQLSALLRLRTLIRDGR